MHFRCVHYRLFQFIGILCCHALTVMDCFGVKELSAWYIRQRWHKDYKRLHVLETIVNYFGISTSTVDDRYNVVSVRCARIADLGSTSKKKFKRALVVLRQLQEDLVGTDNEEECEEPNKVDLNAALLDTVQVKRKGRRRHSRIKSSREGGRKSSQTTKAGNKKSQLQKASQRKQLSQLKQASRARRTHLNATQTKLSQLRITNANRRASRS
ncbi:hypothetical protein Scep_012433 [Stephania cephalantha]|uniref:Protein FAR1-RELATED SEQUENCE n=1 Tax=Stephania cephalantha TaxID=152367 RepID=A0AAP0JFY8_9MAGN